MLVPLRNISGFHACPKLKWLNILKKVEVSATDKLWYVVMHLYFKTLVLMKWNFNRQTMCNIKIVQRSQLNWESVTWNGGTLKKKL